MLKFLRRREQPHSGDGGMPGEQALSAVRGVLMAVMMYESGTGGGVDES
jgi:hypothetical protein